MCFKTNPNQEKTFHFSVHKYKSGRRGFCVKNNKYNSLEFNIEIETKSGDLSILIDTSTGDRKELNNVQTGINSFILNKGEFYKIVFSYKKHVGKWKLSTRVIS